MYTIAVVFLVVEYILFWMLDTPAVPLLQEVVAWLILMAGIVLIALPISALRRGGKVQRGKGFLATERLVDRGIYAVVRHPQYLGWLLLYPAFYLFNPHWQLAIWAVLGVACLVLIARREDKQLVAKFGRQYKRYMQAVPQMNILAGGIRLLRRK